MAVVPVELTLVISGREGFQYPCRIGELMVLQELDGETWEEVPGLPWGCCQGVRAEDACCRACSRDVVSRTLHEGHMDLWGSRAFLGYQNGRSPSLVTSVALKRYFKRLKCTLLNTVRYGT